MYPIDRKAIGVLRRTRWRVVPPTVLGLGMTSLLTDVASEMVTAVLPLYLVVALQLTPVQVGLIDAIHQGAAAFARLAGGWLSDRWQRHKAVAAMGYGLSAACKLGWLGVGTSWPMLSGVMAVDRVGKGLRTAPRDAMIAQASEPGRAAFSFGVHRAFDSAGALAGPLLAFVLLAALPGAYDVIFVTSFFISLAGLCALWLLVTAPRRATAPGSVPPTLRRTASLLRRPKLRHATLAAAALALVSVPDPFFYLQLQRSTVLPLAWFPLLFLVTALAYLALAVPAGRLADRVGRGQVILIGHGLLLAACLALLGASRHKAWGALALLLLGGYYACTDGVLMAAISGWLPANMQASGFAIITTATGLARLCGSALFGLVWETWGLAAAVAAFAAALAFAMLATARVWLRLGDPR